MKLKRKRASKRIISSSEGSITIAEEDPIEEVLENSIVKSATNPPRQSDQKTLLDKYCPLLTVCCI
jgi:hypothetical protein